MTSLLSGRVGGLATQGHPRKGNALSWGIVGLLLLMISACSDPKNRLLQICNSSARIEVYDNKLWERYRSEALQMKKATSNLGEKETLSPQFSHLHTPSFYWEVEQTICENQLNEKCYEQVDEIYQVISFLHRREKLNPDTKVIAAKDDYQPIARKKTYGVPVKTIDTVSSVVCHQVDLEMAIVGKDMVPSL